jgi:hypothetical protein
LKPVTPLKEPLDEGMVQDTLAMCRRTDFFTPAEVEWIEQTLTRPERGYDGFAILEELFAACKAFLESKDKLQPWEVHRAKRIVRGILHARQIVAYKQRNVLIAVPQRIQHPKHLVPCLNGFHPGQHIFARAHSVFGLDYAEARNALVKAALSEDAVTHVLFVDDDVLMPKLGLEQLLSYHLPIVSGTYVKKNSRLETGVTAIGEDPQYIVGQQQVPYEHGNMEPIVVSCTGGGFILIEIEVFQKLGDDNWYEFMLTEDGRVRVGEDSLFCQKAAAKGIKTTVVPGLCALHVDFTKGGRGLDVETYGPVELVDPATRRVRPEHAASYLSFPDDPAFDVRQLVAPDKIDFFGKNIQLKEKGLI